MEEYIKEEGYTGMPDEQIISELAEVFKTFGDSTRIKILFSLAKKEMCVGEIADFVDMSQSAISHQLKILKQKKLVKSQRDGKQIIYSLADDHVYTIIGQGLDHVKE
ncbi:ArsR/SmtB family transcription factor [Lachnobacterium bovis]|uniref:DNA-binding transcriptional regulator, ArsR family n=1 Tax=Lachnobacterium bovis TaxID=140626 RepID=A0A1H9QHV6_9FIRM|nr:metalloregulator ArsR/SmtB family transcription factor [Lachnobacterium bovis]SER60010.1 DNA-binding transcriptional regulator, ArsR family [Lachnobacterium bovis]